MTGRSTATAPNRRVTQNFVTLVASEGVGQLVTFGANAYLARTLDNAAFGLWVFAVSIITYGGFLVDAGTETWGTREVSTDHRRLPATLRAVTALRLRIAICIIIPTLAICFFLPIDPARKLLLAGGTVTLAANVYQAPWALRGLEAMIPVAAGTLLQRITFFTLVLVFVRSAGQVGGITFWQGLADVLVAVIWMLVIRSRTAGAERPAEGAHGWRETLVAAWPFGVARVLRGAMFTLNIVAIKIFWADSVVGIYGAAQRLTAPLLVLSSIFGMAVFPAIVRSCGARATTKVQSEVVGASLRLLAALFIPIVVGGIVIARPALIFVFSGTYASAALPLTLLLVAMLMTVISDNLRRVLHAQHRQVTDLRLVTAAAIVALALNIAAIALWGAMGAGVAALASEALLLALVLRQLAAIGVTGLVLRGLTRPLIAAAIMAACIAPFSQEHLFLAVVSGALIYAAAIFLLGVRIPADLHAIEPAPGDEPITEEVS